MRIRLAFVAITLATLSLVACEPTKGEPSPTPQYPPCEYEDSPGPCSWDASVQGNGRGKSFDRHEDGSVSYWPVYVTV